MKNQILSRYRSSSCRIIPKNTVTHHFCGNKKDIDALNFWWKPKPYFGGIFGFSLKVRTFLKNFVLSVCDLKTLWLNVKFDKNPMMFLRKTVYCPTDILIYRGIDLLVEAIL